MTPNGLDRPNQHRRSFALCLSHRVETMLGVDRVDVKRSRRSKHRGVARCLAARRMTSRITLMQIGFRLDNPTSDPSVFDAVQECLADQIAGDLGGGLSKE